VVVGTGVVVDDDVGATVVVVDEDVAPGVVDVVGVRVDEVVCTDDVVQIQAGVVDELDVAEVPGEVLLVVTVAAVVLVVINGVVVLDVGDGVLLLVGGADVEDDEVGAGEVVELLLVVGSVVVDVVVELLLVVGAGVLVVLVVRQGLAATVVKIGSVCVV